MTDNLELAREYQAFFADKNYIIRVGRGDCPHPDNPEPEPAQGEKSMWYLAHALIGLGIGLSDIEQVDLVATDSNKHLDADEIGLLKKFLQEALTAILNK